VTAIAYRDGVMAADTAIYAGETLQGQVSKIARSPSGALAAASGRATLCEGFLRLFREGKIDEDWRPVVIGDAQFGAVVVEPDGSIWQLDETGRHPVRASFYTEGSAGPILSGAMAAGASAEEAVEIAIRYDAHCGGEIQVERLK
jgi:hypothetical protein